MLPGMPEPGRITSDLTRSVQIMIDARRSSGIITEIDEAVAALVLAAARKLDATAGLGRPSGRAQLLAAMSDLLEQLPAPEHHTAGLLPVYRAALTGVRLEASAAARRPVDEPAALPPLADTAGPQETATHRTISARHAAGLSTLGWQAHEALALAAARDLDAGASVGAASGFAKLVAAGGTILERLPRPTVADSSILDALLATVPEQPSPFTRLPSAAYHPARDSAYLTEGHEIAAVARAMGRHLMPWQRLALDVGTEYQHDELGRRKYRYHTVTIVVPRQSGKTDLTIPLQVHRALTRFGEAACWYTAQSGQDARKRIMELIERVEASPLTELFTPTRSNGAEGLRVSEQPGAHVTRFSPTFSALHGEHPYLVVLDEFWHYAADLGQALIGAIEPAQITLGGRAQLWQVSTMGTAASAFMNAIVADGRAGADPGHCYIEYSLPDGRDPFDPESWPLFHPALGNTIQLEDLARRARRAETDPGRRATFMRAYCNRVVATDGALIDLALWDDLAVPVPRPDPSTVTIGVEVAPTGVSAALVAAWTDPDTGCPCVRIVRQAPGTAWLIPYLTSLLDRFPVAGIAADGAGPVTRFVADLEAAGVSVQTLTLTEFGSATEALLDAAATPDTGLIHDGTDELRRQAATATTRTRNGVRRFDRDAAPIPAIIAAAVALHAHRHPTETATSVVL